MTMQTLPGLPVFYPNIFHTYALINNAQTLDAAGEKIAWVLQIPAAGTLTQVAVAFGTVTTGDSAFSVRLETIDGSTGYPSGTLYATNSNGTINVSSSDDNVLKECDINGGTGVTVAKDTAAVVFGLSDTGPSLGLKYFAGLGSNFPYSVDYGITSAGAWTKGSYTPNIAMKIDGVWYVPYGCFLGPAYTSESVNASGKECGIIINMPVKARIKGIVLQLAVAAGADWKCILYSDPTGSSPVAELTGPIIDGDLKKDTNGRMYFYDFGSSFVLQASTDYALVIQGQTSNTLTLNTISFADTTYSSLFHGGANNIMCSRTSASGAFTLTTTRAPLIQGTFDQFDDGAGTGGGLLTHPGMTGGMRG